MNSLGQQITSKIHELIASLLCLWDQFGFQKHSVPTDNHCLKNGIMQSGSVIASKLLKLDLGAFGGEAKGVALITKS